MITGDHDAAAQATGSQLGVYESVPASYRQTRSPRSNLRHAHGARSRWSVMAQRRAGAGRRRCRHRYGRHGQRCRARTRDIALMTDELVKVPYTIRLSHATRQHSRQRRDIDWIEGAFVCLAVAGVATLWMAVLADTGASALVVCQRGPAATIQVDRPPEAGQNDAAPSEASHSVRQGAASLGLSLTDRRSALRRSH